MESDYGPKLQTFFDPLVGSDAAVVELRDGLSHVVRNRENIDPFEAMSYHMTQLIQAQVPDALPFNIEGQKDWRKINTNSVIGLNVGILALEAVNTLYIKHARSPQWHDNVAHNVSRSTRYLYGLAFLKGSAASYNILALRAGYNPRNPANAPRAFIRGYLDREKPTYFDKAFRVDISEEDGQVVVTPRFKMMGKHGRRVCPATLVKIERGDRQQAALPIVFRTLADVAMQDIYPANFDII